MLIVGEREAGESRVSVRKHGHGDQGSVPLDAFVKQFQTDCAAPV